MRLARKQRRRTWAEEQKMRYGRPKRHQKKAKKKRKAQRQARRNNR